MDTNNVIKNEDEVTAIKKQYDMRVLKFEGIDDWNRPIFEQEETSLRFGSVDILFGGNDKPEDIIKKLEGTEIVYFGISFGCEPMGLSIPNSAIKLIV